MEKLYSNEIVFRGHPDKVCDQISGALLDAFLRGDENTRAGIECVGGKGKVFVTGEVTSKSKVDVDSVVRRVMTDCGYDATGFEVIDNLGQQSPDIAMGVDTGGAGDNGMMFGYACDDTPNLLPRSMVILQEFAEEYDKLRLKDNRFKSDGKAQITARHGKNFVFESIETFTICYQNTELEREETDKILKDIAKQIAKKHNAEIEQFLINPTGKFEIGGFKGDAGLTGRKIVVDSYQSFANSGGGCMNGKDPSKVDFSATHKARELAKRLLREHGLKWCEVQLSYAIGRAQPLAIYAHSDKGFLPPTAEMFVECEPKNIMRDLGLKELCYEDLAKFGHFRG